MDTSWKLKSHDPAGVKQRPVGSFLAMYKRNYQLFITCLLENGRLLLGSHFLKNHLSSVQGHLNGWQSTIAANVTSRWRFLRQIFCFIMYTKVRLRGNPLTTTVITGEWLREMSSRRPNICDSSVSLLDPVRGNLSQSHHDHQLSPAGCVHSWGWLLWYFWYRRWCLRLRIKSDSFGIYSCSNYLLEVKLLFDFKVILITPLASSLSPNWQVCNHLVE